MGPYGKMPASLDPRTLVENRLTSGKIRHIIQYYKKEIFKEV